MILDMVSIMLHHFKLHEGRSLFKEDFTEVIYITKQILRDIAERVEEVLTWDDALQAYYSDLRQ